MLPKMDDAFTLSTKEALTLMSVDEEHGLSEARVKAAREQFGRNGAAIHSPPLERS